jgi:hypothetical protein
VKADIANADIRKTASSPTREYAEYITRALATEGGHLSIGRGGATLYFERGWLSGCHEERIKSEAIAADLPVIDSRSVPSDLAVHGHMVAIGEPPSPLPYHAFAYAPLAVVLEAYRAAGAEVFNVPTVPAPREEEG